MKLSITVNSDKQYELKAVGSTEWELDGTVTQPDIRLLSDKTFHCLINSKSYRVELVEFNSTEKTMLLKVGNSKFSVLVQDEFDKLLMEMGIDINDAHDVLDIKSPMPGLVHKIEVKVGQHVTEGEPLLILEAMKMENVIKSNGEGLIKSILITEGQTVEKNQLLIEFD